MSEMSTIRKLNIQWSPISATLPLSGKTDKCFWCTFRAGILLFFEATTVFAVLNELNLKLKLCVTKVQKGPISLNHANTYPATKSMLA